MATMETISEALKLIDVKKENLRKAFEDLQAHSSSLSSFPLTWSDIDSHFTSLQSSLQHRFNVLQSQSQQPSSSSVIIPRKSSDSDPIPIPIPNPIRSELESFCKKMDGVGLRRYVVKRTREGITVRSELAAALRCAPDAAAMVLDTMEGFFDLYANKLYSFRYLKKEFITLRGCVVDLLEPLMELKPVIGPEMRVRARNLAVEWKGKVSLVAENSLEALGFLILVAAYGLVDCFNTEELVDLAVIAVKHHQQAIKLYRALGLADKASVLIQKLISKGKKLLAIKFSFDFELTKKFPPVRLWKDYLDSKKKLAEKVGKGRKNSLRSLNKATTTIQEVNAMKGIIKYIEDHELECELPKESILKHIEKIEKEKADRKRPAAAPAPRSQQQSKQQKQSGSRHPRSTEPAGSAAIPKSVAAASSTLPSLQQPNLQPAVSLPDRPAPYLSEPGPYGLGGSTLAVASYPGSSALLYNLAGASLVSTGNLTPTGSHQYPLESQMPSLCTDRPIAYGGYDLPPQYHPSYYPH